MTGSRLHEHRPRFEETNDFIDFILGLCSLAPRSLSEFKTAPPLEGPHSTLSEEGFVYFVLGLLKLASGFERLIAVEARDPPHGEEAPREPAVLRDLLR